MLRLALSIYQMNPIPAHQLSEIRLSEDEKNDHGITELIWFQFLAGAQPNQIESNLIAFRQLQSRRSSVTFAPRTHTPEVARDGDKDPLPCRPSQLTHPAPPYCAIRRTHA